MNTTTSGNHEKRDQEAAENYVKGPRQLLNDGVRKAEIRAFLAGIAHARAEAEALREEEGLGVGDYAHLQKLREENARLMAELECVESWKDRAENQRDEIKKAMESEITRLRAQLAEAVKELEFYAEGFTKRPTESMMGEFTPALVDRGARAQEFLAKLRKDGT